MKQGGRGVGGGEMAYTRRYRFIGRWRDNVVARNVWRLAQYTGNIAGVGTKIENVVEFAVNVL